MIDPISIQDIHNATKAYKFGGVMPLDVQADLNEFREELNNPELSSEERIAFEQAIANIMAKYPDETQLDEISMQDDAIDYLINGNWYKQHPEKLIGTPILDKNRYGDEIQVIKGTLSDLSRIELDSDLKQLAKNVNIGLSEVKETVSEKLNDPSNQEFIAQIIEKSNVSIGFKAVQKKKKKEESLNEDYQPKVENIQTYKEIFKKLNPSISNEELKAYIWYKEKIGQRLSSQWYELAYGDGVGYMETSEEQVSIWAKTGLLFYSDGELLPLPLFVSGNVYEKISRLVKVGENSGGDIDYIVNTYGAESLAEHLRVLNQSYSSIYDNRLIITGNEDDKSLILKPTSKFARAFMIDHTNSFEEFKWWGYRAGDSRPKFDKIEGREYQKDTFESLSLTDAYCLWLTINRNKLEIKGNITYYDIIYYYIDKRHKSTPQMLSAAQEAEFKANQLRLKSKSAMEGNRLFLQFLAEELDINQKVAVETQWNASFNNYAKVDYNKIPVAFNVTNSFFGEEPFEIKPEKREAVSFLFNEGTGCLAFDVGVGKSISAIFTMEQFMVAGYCKRPFVVIPNQTYKQWLSEIKNALPHRKINGLYNLGNDYIEQIVDENNNIQMVEEGSISVITYEGFSKLGFNESTRMNLMSSLYEILNQGGADEQLSDKQRASFREKLEGLIGKGLKGTNIEIESLGFDFVCYDEAHALKKVFTTVKGEAEEKGKKAKTQYSLQSGMPSNTALKGFMISNYILKSNNNRNVIMLTATPFTNSPLEVFSMLAMVAYHHLAKLGIVNINDFFDNYIDVRTELTINHKMTPQYKQVVKGFNNLPSLQKIIFRFFNYKDGDDVGVERPNKIVIPYTKVLVDGTIVKLDDDKQVTSNIEMTALQKSYMDDIVAYAEGKSEISSRASEDEGDEDENEPFVEYKGSKIYGDKESGFRVDGEIFETLKEAKDSLEESNIEEEALSKDEKSGVRALKSMNYSRNLALSPYLYQFNNLSKPTYQTYISTSPKLQYVMDCIRSVKKYHEEHNEPVSGQVIYMDRGVKYFNLIKDYLIYEIGFMPHEVGMITGSMNSEKKRIAQDAFLGQKYNEKTKDYESITDEQRMKVLIGTGSIKEGMNLQKKSTVLYNCFLDWNPTDVIQLEGRIWRQKNQFANVRIVNPLVMDSIDIFMFQKLEEKTSRINTIWSANGKSVFKIEELDPEELKFALIKDPRTIAKLEVETKSVKLRDEVNSIKVIDDRLEKYIEAQNNLEYYGEKVDNVLKEFAPNKVSLDLMSKINYLVGVYKSDMPKDGMGRIMLGSYDKQQYSRGNHEYVEKYKGVEISPFEQPYKQYWFSYLTDAKRLIEKEDRDLLSPRNIDKNNVKMYIEDSKLKMADIEKEIEYLKSDDYVKKRSEEIFQKRLDEKIETKTIGQLVVEFERLNYLLSIKKGHDTKPKAPFVYDKSVFLDENGLAKIDEATIALLTEGVSSLPQTKELNVDANGEYTEDRRLLHYDIINRVKNNSHCVDNDSPIAILTGGSPASGKSTFLKTYAPYLLSDEIMKIDADEIRAMLPEYEGWNAAVTHLETKDIVNTLLTDSEIGIPCKFDLIYDGTMNSAKNYLPLIGLLHRLGYKVFIIYMDNVPYQVVKDRSLKRYQNPQSGRFVPLEVIDDFFSKGKAALDELKTKVDGYMVVDANSKDYKIIEEGGMKLPDNRNYQKLGRPVKTGHLVTKLIKAIKLLSNV